MIDEEFYRVLEEALNEPTLSDVTELGELVDRRIREVKSDSDEYVVEGYIYKYKDKHYLVTYIDGRCVKFATCSASYRFKREEVEDESV
jgi:hypothetical protein